MSFKRFELRVVLTGAIVGLVLAGCGGAPKAGKNYLLMFTEKERGRDPYQTRMIVTPKYLRIDDGKDGGDYLLFDRATRVVYNVVHDDQTILVVKPQPIHLQPPKVFKHTVEKSELKDSPTIDGKKVTRYVLRTNGKQCFEVDAVAGLLDGPRNALIEFAEALTGEHAAGTALTPEEMRSDCDLADNVFVPGRHLKYGFPIRQQDSNGKVRILTDYKTDYVPDPKLFQLPAAYSRYTPAQMRGTGT